MLNKFVAILTLKVLYDSFLAASVPSRELFGFWPQNVQGPDGKTYVVNRVSIEMDDVALAALIAFGAGPVGGVTGNIVPKVG